MDAPRTRVQRRPVHGVLLLDKPLGLSSNQALQKAKWLLRADKAGHTGTLDPLATGVLPLCFGAATKFSQLQLDADKAYEALAQLGQTTSTGDAEGAPLELRAVDLARLQPQHLEALAQRFTGRIQQIAPMYSAIKKDGKALYQYARAGIEIERSPREIEIFSLKLLLAPVQTDKAAIKIIVTCSKGSYIRTLAEDIGQALGCGAHLIALRRSRSGDFAIQHCLTLDALEAMSEAERLACLLPLQTLLTGHVRITLEAAEAARFLSGLRRRGPWPDAERVAVYGPAPTLPLSAQAAELPAPAQQDADVLLGTAQISAGQLIPGRLLNPLEIQQILLQHRP